MSNTENRAKPGMEQYVPRGPIAPDGVPPSDQGLRPVDPFSVTDDELRSLCVLDLITTGSLSAHLAFALLYRWQSDD